MSRAAIIRSQPRYDMYRRGDIVEIFVAVSENNTGMVPRHCSHFVEYDKTKVQSLAPRWMESGSSGFYGPEFVRDPKQPNIVTRALVRINMEYKNPAPDITPTLYMLRFKALANGSTGINIFPDPRPNWDLLETASDRIPFTMFPTPDITIARYEPIPEPEPDVLVPRTSADVDRDGDTDMDDAYAIFNIFLQNLTPEEIAERYDLEAADINQDGVVNSTDGVLTVLLSQGRINQVEPQA